MAQSEFSHQPVLRDEVVALFASVPDGVVVDATLGGGGHSRALLETYPGLRVVGLDRDPVALAAAGVSLHAFGERVRVEHAPFSSIGSVIASIGGAVSGVLFDLGVSSPQLDVAERGFSFRQDSAIDMRMDQSTGMTAGELVNTASEGELSAMFREAGETRFAGRIARSVVRARPLTSTQQLADVVAAAVPAAVRRKGHPARRVFMALRIEVNDELGELAAAVPAALEGLAVGGVCVVISYHSGEDRLVKEVFASAASGGCVCPPGLPCVCGAAAEHQLVFRGSRKPAATEVEANRRAESARMRAIVRTSERAI
jgi:16S rRNA (cytosine1402-N4)-methyltransferase